MKKLLVLSICLASCSKDKVASTIPSEWQDNIKFINKNFKDVEAINGNQLYFEFKEANKYVKNLR